MPSIGSQYLLSNSFAVGWNYAISWLTVLPFEITAAGITIEFWRDDINIGVWIAVFLSALIIVQFFGVRGYGEGLFRRKLLLAINLLTSYLS